MPAAAAVRGMPSSPSSASTRAKSASHDVAEPEHARHLGVLGRDDVGAVAGRRHELRRDRRVVAEDLREEERVGAAVRDAEARADGVGERVVDADERVGEGEPGDRRAVGHLRPRGQVVAVREGARQRVEDHPDGLQAQRVGVRRGEDRHVGLERVRQRVDAGVRGQRRRHRDRQARLDDRLVGDQRVVDERELRAADRQHGGRRDLGAGAGGGGHGDQPGAVRILREAGDPLARVQERQRELGARSARDARRAGA